MTAHQSAAGDLPMLPDDLDRVERNLLERLIGLKPDPREDRIAPTPAAELFEAQVASRIIDHVARRLRAEHGRGYYTIASAGHEANAAVAMSLRPTDPALLHYRSGGFYLARAAQVPDQDPVGDVLRGMLALSSDQIAGGRHKVFGNRRLNIIPQTSTIASHLPRAVGLAVSIGRRSRPSRFPSGKEDGRESSWPDDALVVASVGDASLNHSTAQGALNWAANVAHRHERVPILFVCEDNGLGISVPTPDGWVAASTIGRPALEWATVEGSDPADVLEVTADLAETIRDQGIPGFLHLRTVRYLGHAGTDVESGYRPPAELTADLRRDPIVGTGAAVVSAGVCSGAELAAWYLSLREEIHSRALALADSTTEVELTTAAEVMQPLVDGTRIEVLEPAGEILTTPVPESRSTGEALTLARTINRTLEAVLIRHPEALVFGEDVGRKGGVYGVTRGLQDRFGPERVFDTILDEQSILGFALGAGLDGHLPIPEIQYLAYLHNAEDQLRGEAATLGFFSQGQYRNPMVIRIAAYAYQRGFGGHFHNDNAIAVLRDIPGLIVASPGHPADAGPVLAACVAAADQGAVCAFLEPIARYHTTDLHAEGDGGWTSPLVTDPAAIGTARVHGDGSDGTIITWANGLYLSLQAQRVLAEQHGQQWRVVDLRWVAPLPTDDLVREAVATARALIVDETRRSGGLGEGVLATLVESGFRGPMARVSAADSFIPLGAAADLVLVDRDEIITAALELDR